MAIVGNQPGEFIEYIYSDKPTATVVDVDHNVELLQQDITGEKWTVTYFNQVKGESDALGGLDVTLPSSMQSYLKVNELDIMVQSTLSYTPDDVTGTAITIGGLIPQPWDYLLVSLIDGRKALLVVDNVTTLSYGIRTAFEINYKLDSFLDSSPDRIDNIFTKIVAEYYFMRSDEYNKTPVIVKKNTLDNKRKVSEQLRYLPTYYIDKVLDPESSLLLLPNNRVIDVELSNFFFSLIDDTYINDLSRVNRVGDVNSFITENIYNVLMQRNAHMLPRVRGKLHSVNFDTYTTSIGLTGEYQQTIRRLQCYNIVGTLTSTIDGISDIGIPVSTDFLEYIGVLPTNITRGDDYIFSEGFYMNNVTSDTSLIERMLLQYLNKETLSEVDILRLLETYIYWNDEEIFFYLPFVIFILKISLMEVWYDGVTHIR